MVRMFGRTVASHELDSEVARLERIRSPASRARAEDMREDGRVGIAREQELVSAYGRPQRSAQQVLGRLDQFTTDTVRRPAAGAPRFMDATLNRCNIATDDWAGAAGGFLFSQLLDLTFLLTIIGGRLGGDAVLRRLFSRADRLARARGAAEPDKAAWLAALEQDAPDLDRLVDRTERILKIASDYKPERHPTWIAPLPAAPRLASLSPPGTWETALARRGKRADDAFVVHLIYRRDQLLAPGERVAIPTVLDGGTVGIWHRAPRNDAFRAQRSPSERRRSGLAVDLRASAPDHDLTRELLVRDIYPLWPAAFALGGNAVTRTAKRPMIAGSGAADPCSVIGDDIDIRSVRRRHKQRLVVHFGGPL